MSTVNGLPAHILLVHAIVVLLPLCAVLLVATAVWPAARRKLAGANAILATLTLVLVPVTTNAGEWLQARVDNTDSVSNHVELGNTALYVALPVAVLAVIVWWRGRERAGHEAALAAGPATSSPTVADPAQSGPGGGGATRTAVATPTHPAPTRRVFLAPASTVATVALAVLSVLAAGAAIYDVYLIGDSGARATWQDRVTGTPQAPQGGESADNGG
ncbi:hypothetical protein GCM10027047_39230 [Rhodococcus aerolatus]